MAKKKPRDSAPLRVVSQESDEPSDKPQVKASQPQIKASLVFGNIVDVMKRGLFSGSDCRTAAEAIMFLEQVKTSELSAEAAKEGAVLQGGAT